MAPTLRHGDVVLVRMTRGARVGDVVLVSWDARPGQLSVKRAMRPESEGWHVRGDNAFASTDSRELGAARILGVVLARLYPRPGRIRRPG